MPSLLAIPFKEYDDDFFGRMEHAARYAALSQEEKMQYDREMKEIWDRASELETAINKGRAEGEAKGRAEGRAEGEVKGRAEMAKSLKAAGVDVKIIAQTSGLSIDEINKM